jgi:hypothetical protein
MATDWSRPFDDTIDLPREGPGDPAKVPADYIDFRVKRVFIVVGRPTPASASMIGTLRRYHHSNGLTR